MAGSDEGSFTVFDGVHKVASGPLHIAGPAAKRAFESGASGPILVFDDTTGRSRDLDMRGPFESVRPRGRPKLGVVAREVTLLPRHWEWLASQPGGASVALRRLVDSARHSSAEQRRQALERAYHFMTAMAGDFPGFEEATRALFAHDAKRFAALIGDWPPDVRDHAIALAAF